MNGMSFAHEQLRSFIDRIIRLKGEQDAIGADIRETYKEAHAAGFDKTVMGLVVQRLRKEDKAGRVRVEETDSLLDLYMHAYRGGGEDGEGNDPGAAADAIRRAGKGRETASETAPRTRMREDAGMPAGPDVRHDPVTGEVIERDGARAAA